MMMYFFVYVKIFLKGVFYINDFTESKLCMTDKRTTSPRGDVGSVLCANINKNDFFIDIY